MHAAPFIGFVTAAVLVKVLASRRNKIIKKAFEVNELTEEEVKAWTDESNQGELIGRREGAEVAE